MPRSIRVDGAIAKVETTYATDAVPLAADGVRVAQRVWSNMTPEFHYPNLRSDVANGGLRHAAPAAPGGRLVRFNLGWDARGAGVAYATGSVVPEADPLIVACGYSRVHDDTPGLETVTYTKVDTGHDSCTVHLYADGKLFPVVGCRGNLRIPISAGAIGMWVFEMVGIQLVDATDAALPSIIYDAVVPTPQQGITFALGGFTPDLISAEFNAGTEVEVLADATATNGIGEIAIVEYLSELTMNVYAPTVAERDMLLDWANATALTLDIDSAGAQYNKWTLDIASGVHISNIALAESERVNTFDVTAITSVGEVLVFD